VQESLLLQCGINVRANSPGSQTGYDDNKPCGPNLSIARDFKWADNSPLKDLHIT